MSAYSNKSRYQLPPQTDTSDFLDQISQKKCVSVENDKIERQLLHLHIQINLVTKFQLKPAILSFRPNLPKRVFFKKKTENVNTTII